MVDQIDAPPCSLRKADALEGVGQQRIARARLDDQQVVEGNAFDEAAGAADGQSDRSASDVNGTQAGVITMRQRVDQGFPEASRLDIGYRDAEQANLDLALYDAGQKLLLDALEQANQRPAIEVVDPDIGAVEDLECRLVGRDVRRATPVRDQSAEDL